MNELEKIKNRDLSAPKIYYKKKKIIDKDFIQKFIEEFPQYKNISRKDFENIVNEFNEKIYTFVINNPDGIELPYNLGRLFIASLPSLSAKQYNKIDYKESIKRGVAVPHMNWDTDNKYGKVIYSTSTGPKRSPEFKMWYFVPSRKFDRAQKAAYKKLYPMYITFESRAKLTEYKKKGIIGYISEEKEVKYDNFDL